MDNRWQIHFVSQTVAMLLISQEIDRQSQPTLGQYGHETLLSERADETIDRHRREMTDDRTEFQTQSAVSGPQGITGHLRSHLAIAQDEVRQDGEHSFALRTLETPDGETTQPDTDIMGVARQAPAAAIGRLVCELKPEGQDERQHPFDKRLAVAQQLKVRGFVSKIDGDGPVFTGLASCVSHGHPQVRWSL